MKIEKFETSYSSEWETAAFDSSKGVLQVTIFADEAKMDDSRYFLDVANDILEKVQKLRHSLKCDFLGATRISNCFPSLSFAYNTNADAHKLHGALSGHFVDHPIAGYDIRYRELK